MAAAVSIRAVQNQVKEWLLEKARQEHEAYTRGLHLSLPYWLHPEETMIAATDEIPAEVLEAYDWYRNEVESAEWGKVRLLQIPFGETNLLAVRVLSDGDEGWLEVFDAKGKLLAKGVTYLEIIDWQSRTGLRNLVIPRDLSARSNESLWKQDLTG